MKKIIVSIFFMLMSFYSVADAYPWDENNEALTLVFGKPNYRVDARIEPLNKIYFKVHSGEISTCNQVNKYGEEVVASIDNKNVRMLLWCFQYSDSNMRYIQMKAETDAGRKYIIDRFNKSKDYVDFKFGEYSAKISAIGFTRIWNKLERDAM